MPAREEIAVAVNLDGPSIAAVSFGSYRWFKLKETHDEGSEEQIVGCLGASGCPAVFFANGGGDWRRGGTGGVQAGQFQHDAAERYGGECERKYARSGAVGRGIAARDGAVS